MSLYHISSNWDKFEAYRRGLSRGLRTGFTAMDEKLISIPAFTMIMGEPKTCKSTMAMQILLNKALEGYPCLLIDQENGLFRTRYRMLCQLGQIPDSEMKSATLKGAEPASYSEAVSLLTKLPIDYMPPAITLELLEQHIKQTAKAHKKRVLVVVDSIQSLVTNLADRRHSVDSWVFGINNMKNALDGWVTFIVVSEKNRGSYGKASKSGAKESGGLEYKAEMVLDMYPSKQGDEIFVNCNYNRDGETGIVTVLAKPTPYCYMLEEVDVV